MTAFDVEQALGLAIPSFDRVVVPPNPFGIEDALVGQPIGDVILWVMFGEDQQRVYPWYSVMPLFHPDSDGLGIEVGSLLGHTSRPSELRSGPWLRRDPEAGTHLSKLIAHEGNILRNRFGSATGWATNAIPDPRDYDDFPDLVETMAYAHLLIGQYSEASALLRRLSVLEDTVGLRSAEMHDLILRDRTGALRLLDTWRSRRLAMFGLGPR